MSRNYIGTISQRFYRNEEKQASVCFSCDMCELEKTARVIPTRSDRETILRRFFHYLSQHLYGRQLSRKKDGRVPFTYTTRYSKKHIAHP